MAQTKFAIGQLVDFNPGRATIPASSKAYEVIRLLPLESGERRYRIKTTAEQFERVAKESELSTRTLG